MVELQYLGSESSAKEDSENENRKYGENRRGNKPDEILQLCYLRYPSNLQGPSDQNCFAHLDYHEHIRNAHHTDFEDDLAFRELVHAILCIYSCSPEVVNLCTKAHPDVSNPYSTNLAYRPALGTEFASSLLEGYHLMNFPPGISPASRCYWFLDVLVCLNKNLDSLEGIKSAVVDAVSEGKYQGRHFFNAIVISMSAVVLIRVMDEKVEHTAPLEVEAFYAPTWMRIEDAISILDERNTPTFEAIAQLFETTAQEKLHPSGSGRHGYFPNEIYQNIIGYADPLSRIACLSVSRTFREFALDAFCMSNELTVAATSPETEPECLHPTTGNLGRLHFKLDKSEPSMSRRRRQEPPKGRSTSWFPVLGLQGASSILPHLKITFAVGEVRKKRERVLELNSVIGKYKQRCHRLQRSGRESSSFEYQNFEQMIPSKEITASSESIAALFSLVFFLDLEIFGCSHEHFYPSSFLDPTEYVRDIPKDIIMQIGSKKYEDISPVERFYGLSWNEQASEDTESGWNAAIEEAIGAANSQVLRYMYSIQDDFAIMVIIGTKFTVLHLKDSLPIIPAPASFPALEKAAESSRPKLYVTPDEDYLEQNN
ncbi:hypothetical protein BS50DRAFT_593484 [Corynespora cassiicola Philippines]|uniref:F-box domain-containing protein n=1 Tax=Corynespora cassiicola Philippines TaxID=1448308 RepID=A0A2T2N5M0_CORCC|nr:hypothetical protein BS50DRAFT_593484 [Corynespora cassiicola Philippines]